MIRTSSRRCRGLAVGPWLSDQLPSPESLLQAV